MNNPTDLQSSVPGPADVFCSKCGRYHASITCCPEPENNPTRPEAVQEAMNRAVELNATYEFQRELKGVFTEKNDKELLVDLADYVRELEAERDRLQSELAEARKGRG